MNNSKLEKFKEITHRYVNLEKEVREYRDQFFTVLWNEKIIREATKVLTSEELQKLKDMEDELEKVRKEYTEALKDLMI